MGPRWLAACNRGSDLKKFFLALLFLIAVPITASAQCNGVFSANQLCGTGSSGPPTGISTGPVVFMASFGVVGDGATNNDAAIARGLATIPNNVGAIVIFPCGTILTTNAITLSQQGIYKGCGINVANNSCCMGTTIKTSSASNDVIDVTNIGITVEDMTLLSSVAAGSRTGAGLKIAPTGNVSTGTNWIYIRRVQSVGHKYGLWDQVPNVEFDHIYSSGNNSHGIFFDGSNAAVSATGASEVVCYECQGNGNTGSGIVLGGLMTGAQLIHPVAAANGAGGIVIKRSSAGQVSDVYITQPEISGNTGSGIDISSNSSGVGLTVNGGLNEGNTVAGINCGSSFSQATFSNMEGGTTTGTWIIANCQDSTYNNIVMLGSGITGVEVGSNSLRQTFSNIVMTNCVVVGTCTDTFTKGFQFDASAGQVLINNVDVSTTVTPFTGTLPAGSIITGSTLTLVPAPTANSCTGFSLNTGSNDYAGHVNYTSNTTCSVTFGHTFANPPSCTVSPESGAATAQVSAISTAGFTATFGSALTKFAYQCSGA